MKNLNAVAQYVFKTKTLFVETTVKDLLFDGVTFCENPTSGQATACQSFIATPSTTIRVTDNSYKFSFFYHKNTTNDGDFEVYTGTDDIHTTHRLLKWNDQSELQTWLKTDDSNTCNQVGGTDGSSYTPFQKPEGSITSFSADICRGVDLHFDKEQEYEGINGYKFSVRGSFLTEIGPDHSNECFCVNKQPKAIVQSNGCLYRGALDLFNCQRAPMVLTNPHMYDAAEEYTTLIEGLNSNAEEHSTFIHLEPVSRSLSICHAKKQTIIFIYY